MSAPSIMEAVNKSVIIPLEATIAVAFQDIFWILTIGIVQVEGKIMIWSLKFFTDINECDTNNGGCEQICTNNAQSYQCSCREGFRLYNNYYCSGI